MKLSINLSKDQYRLLENLAKQENITVSEKALGIIAYTLEQQKINAKPQAQGQIIDWQERN